ncbi:hypothetical protein AG1IA_05074 [Rhizoctonia solani AG-1 IA]|uniref:Uncharacterized protein n=1 Tax=Thanatephorus cucumeris (strain AG1-IA) TaxID=983506 RepID=L8WVV2_THACA|nr:hypothetical protein AG1IA_05074 [Rhizoctonia solani AG-1 IA]
MTSVFYDQEWIENLPSPSAQSARLAKKIGGGQFALTASILADVGGCQSNKGRVVIYSPVVPVGKTAVSMEIWPCKTRVNARFSCAVGVPKC